MSFPDLVGALRSRMPSLRGRLLPNQQLAELTWFRVGGPAQVLFMPEDEDDLCYFLRELPRENGNAFVPLDASAEVCAVNAGAQPTRTPILSTSVRQAIRLGA